MTLEEFVVRLDKAAADLDGLDYEMTLDGNGIYASRVRHVTRFLLNQMAAGFPFRAALTDEEIARVKEEATYWFENS